MLKPHLNSEGKPAIPLTEEERYQFDTKGWLALPAVLTPEEAAEMRDFCYRLRNDPASIPSAERSSIGGPLLSLTDHPRIVGFMNEFVSHQYIASDASYGFRFEGSFLAIRANGDTNFRPHGGSGYFNFPGNSHVYRTLPGKIHSGLTRAVWELNPVKHRKGGTLFLSGSHKAAYPAPESTENEDSPLWETYECPAGSLLFFTEAICHSGALWTDAENDRVAVFNCYNTVNEKWHNWNPNPELLEAMPPLRQSLFRGVYCQDNVLSVEG